jgi:hypothetical protein
VPVPPRADGCDADGLGGSWQDLQVLRAQSMAQRGNALHYTHVSSSRRQRGAGWRLKQVTCLYGRLYAATRSCCVLVQLAELHVGAAVSSCLTERCCCTL